MNRSMSLFDVRSTRGESDADRCRDADGPGCFDPPFCDALTTALMIHTSTNRPRTMSAISGMVDPEESGVRGQGSGVSE
jgi:hypothetical protein